MKQLDTDEAKEILQKLIDSESTLKNLAEEILQIEIFIFLMNYVAFILLIFLHSCSFDNKSGIWKNENINKIKKNSLSDFKTLSIKTFHLRKQQITRKFQV